MSAAPLQIRLLGELQVLRQGKPLALPPSKKTRALLGYLVATARPHGRERLAELLWDIPDDPRAALRWSLWKLRPLLARPRGSALTADRERVAFEGAGVEVDVAQVRVALGGGAAEATVEALRAAAAHFRGELLEGLDLPDCYRYHEWCAAERESLRALHVAVLSTLVARLRASPEEALPFARRWVAIDPLREEGHVQVVTLLGTMGRTREALAQYESCRRILAGELGAAPSAHLEQARAALSGGAAPSRRPPAITVPRAVEAPPLARPVITPLVARQPECDAIAAQVAAAVASRCDQALLFVGEPGIGKSRLLEELAWRAGEAGGTVLLGRSFEAERARPYGAWIDALRPVLAGAALPPAVASALGPLRPGGELAAPATREAMFQGVAGLLAHLGAAGPVALLLDDVQWLDEISAALLHFVVRGAGPGRLLVGLAARGGELADNPPALRAVRALVRDRRLIELPIGPLDAAAVADLIRPLGGGLDPARVWRESEGNPLFAREVARALASDGVAVSDTLEALIADRLGALGDRARQLVPWLAAYGRRFSPGRVALLSQLPAAQVLAALDDLARLDIVRASPTAAGAADSDHDSDDDGGGYDFTHDLIRRVAYQRVPAPSRKLLHARIAEGLAQLPDADGALAADVARHAAEAGAAELCVRAAIRAGQRCLRLFAFREAEAMADLGRHYLPRLPLAEVRVPLHLALLKILIYPGVRLRKPDGLIAEIARLSADAEQAGLAVERGEALHLLGWIHHLTWGDLPRARAHVLQTAELVRKLPVPQNLEAILSSARCLAVLEVHMPRAHALFRELAAFGPAATENLFFQWGLGLVLRWDGDVAGARAALEKGSRLAHGCGDHWAAFECTAALVALELETGRPDQAAALCSALAPLAVKLGDGGSEGAYVAALAALATLAGDDGRAADDANAALVRAIDALEKLDARYLLAFVLNAAAEIDLQAGRWPRARQRATRGLEAATIASRAPEVARALSLLARAAAAAGDPDEVRRQVALLEAGDPEQLSGHARRALEAAVAKSSATRNRRRR